MFCKHAITCAAETAMGSPNEIPASMPQLDNVTCAVPCVVEDDSSALSVEKNEKPADNGKNYSIIKTYFKYFYLSLSCVRFNSLI